MSMIPVTKDPTTMRPVGAATGAAAATCAVAEETARATATRQQTGLRLPPRLATIPAAAERCRSGRTGWF